MEWSLAARGAGAHRRRGGFPAPIGNADHARDALRRLRAARRPPGARRDRPVELELAVRTWRRRRSRSCCSPTPRASTSARCAGRRRAGAAARDRSAADDPAGAVAAAAVFGELSVEEALILAVVLAPTDAALGQAVVTEPRVPARIRQGLNVESGLNDGICVPLLFAAVAAADVESEISGGRGAGDAAARGDRLRRPRRRRGRPARSA